MEGRPARVRLTALAIVLSFLLGSVPFGLVLTRSAGLGDIRRIGSGNIGATNVLRTGRRDLAAATMVLDAAKGTVAVLLARHWGSHDLGAIAGLAAVLGHTLTPWLRFHGGKGVATGCGVLLGIAWPLGLAIAAIWVTIVATTRLSSLGALAACAAAPLIALYLTPYPWPVIVIAAWIAWRHRANIARLRAGTEPRVGTK
jgi:glycerol-3-phosphate acyltransferase PlsY